MGGVPSKPQSGRSIEVINAGYCRTGTVSMQMALEKLFNGPVQHGATYVLQSGDAFTQAWNDALAAKRVGDHESCLKLLRKVTDGYISCTDFPSCSFVPEFVELYPEAKVILVTRDPVKWWPSFKPIVNNITSVWANYLTLVFPGLRHFHQIVEEWKVTVDKLVGETPLKDYGPSIIEAHNKQVMDVVPKERLLVIDIKDLGWEPICKFLDKPIPDEPFPRENDADAAQRAAMDVLKKLLVVWGGGLVVLGGSVYLGRRLMQA